MNHIFMQQFWSGDLALYQKLQQDKSALGKARLHYFWINKARGRKSTSTRRSCLVCRRRSRRARISIRKT